MKNLVNSLLLFVLCFLCAAAVVNGSGWQSKIASGFFVLSLFWAVVYLVRAVRGVK